MLNYISADNCILLRKMDVEVYIEGKALLLIELVGLVRNSINGKA